MRTDPGVHTVTRDGNVIRIIDQGTGKSFTNSVEAVLPTILAGMSTSPEDLAKLRVIYRDTDGRWDGIQTDDQGKPTAFILMGIFSETTARDVARNAESWPPEGMPVTPI